MKNLILVLLSVLVLGSDKYELSLKLEKGKTYYLNQESDILIHQTLEGQHIDIEMKMDAQYSYVIKEIKKDFYEADCQITTMYYKMKTPYSKMEFDSKNPEVDIFNQAMIEMINKPFHLKLNFDGTIKEMTGIKQIIDDLIEKFNYLPDETLAEIRKLLNDTFGKDALKGSFELITAIFPNTAVNVNERWKKSIKTNSSMEFTQDYTYTLNKAKRKYYLLSGEADISSETKRVSIGDSYATYHLKGKAISDVKVDRKTGWIMDMDIRQNIKGHYDLEVPGDSKTYKVPVDMKTHTVIRGGK
jgi:hypothetical protein